MPKNTRKYLSLMAPSRGACFRTDHCHLTGAVSLHVGGVAERADLARTRTPLPPAFKQTKAEPREGDNQGRI